MRVHTVPKCSEMIRVFRQVTGVSLVINVSLYSLYHKISCYIRNVAVNMYVVEWFVAVTV